MLFAFLYSCLRLLLDVVDVRLRRNESEAELLLLRHEIRVLRRQINRPRLTTADRIVMAAFHRLVSRPALGGLVQPETVLGWHRELVRRKVGSVRPATRRRTTRARSERQRVDLDDGSREPSMGLHSHSRRTAEGWASGFRDGDRQPASAE